MGLSTVTYKILPNGNIEAEVSGVLGHACTRITEPTEEAVGEVRDRKYQASYFVTDSNPAEKRIELLEEEDWRGCCGTHNCAL